MSIVPPVLITFDQDRVATRNTEPSGWVACKVVVQREGLAVVLVPNRRFQSRPRQRRRRRGAANQSAFEDLVELTVRANEEGDARVGGAIADRIANVCTVVLGVRTALGEPGLRRC